TDDLQDYGMGMGIGLAPYGNFSVGFEIGGLDISMMARNGDGESTQTTANNSPAMKAVDAVIGNGNGNGSGVNGSETGSMEWNQWMNVNGV
ncbi:hypothetical protein KEM56_002668, partial [Ascosphaera pollenicola]